MYHDSNGIGTDTTPALGTVALADAPALEQDAADARRATLADAGFDPDGLYAAEQERDEAASLIGETVKDPAVSVSLYVVRSTNRMHGRWETTTNWIATYLEPGQTTLASFHGYTPTEAAARLVAAWTAARAARLVA